ncbi:MAG: AMP-binding protein, partial [Actinomycetota bacterium]
MNIAALAEQNVERFGEYDAYFWQDRWHTNVEGVENARRFANALTSMGVGPGDRVAVMLPNCIEVFFAYGGTLGVGGVVVPVVFLLAPGEINHILADCEPKVLITSPLFLDKAREAIQGLPNPPRLVIFGDPVPDDATSWNALMSAASTEHATVDRSAEDIAVIM